MDWVELLAGAVVGVVSAALFEDGLRRKIHNTLTRLTASVRRSRLSAFDSDQFALGPLNVPVQLVEGDGTRAIAKQNVLVTVDPTMVKLPAELAAWKVQLENEQQTADRKQFWNGLRYSVENVECSRTPRKEDPEVYIRLRHTDYFTFLAVQQHDRQFSDGTTIKQRYIDGKSLDEIPDFIFSSFGINVAVVTSDQFLIVSHRSGKLGSGGNEWNVSANEGLSRDLDSSGRHPPDLYRVAERGLVEELALEYGEYDLSMLGIGLERKRYQWAAFFVAKLRSLTAAELQDRHARGIQDRWEHRTLEYVAFRPNTVLEYLLQPDKLDHWAPCAPVGFWLALINTYGRPRVERTARHLSPVKRRTVLAKRKS
jgi:hypothetical protein